MKWKQSLWAIGLTVAIQATALGSDDSLSLLVKAIAETESAEVQANLLQGMLQGLEGRRNLPMPPHWKSVGPKLLASSNDRVTKLATQLSQLFGDEDALSKTLNLLQDVQAGKGERELALRTLLDQQNVAAQKLVPSLVNDPNLQIAAVRGLATFENTLAIQDLLQRFAELNEDAQRAVVETCAARRSYASQLLAAIQNQNVSKSDLPAHVTRNLSQLLGAQFTRIFGEIRDVEQDREARLANYKKLASPSAMSMANASRGRTVFNKTCGTCHQLYGTGGNVGPDLTGSNRANLDYILLNSVDPSFDVPDAYKTTIVQTIDGRMISGVLAEEDGARVVLKTAEIPRVVIAKEDIEERKTSDKSMMPEGQLEQLKKQEVLDLLKYLRTTQQVEAAK